MGVIPEALDLPPGSQPWKRYVDGELAAQQRQIDRGDQNLTNAINALQNTVKLLGDQITALPVIHVMGDNQTNFGLTDQWVAHATTGFLVPKGKPRVQVYVSIDAAVLDTTSSGVTRAEGRVNFGGVLSHVFSSAKDANTASAVNNIIVGSSYYSYPNLIPGAYYSLSLELRGLNATAFTKQTQNYANINVIVSHTG